MTSFKRIACHFGWASVREISLQSGPLYQSVVRGFSSVSSLFIWDICANWCDNAWKLHIMKSLMHLFRGHFGARENVRSTSTNCTNDLHWGLGGQERRGGQSGQRNKLPCLFCAPRPGWNQCVAGSQKTQAGWEETGPALINYSEPGHCHLCRVEGGHSAGLWNDLTMWRTPAPTLQDVVCPLPPKCLRATTLRETRDDGDIRLDFLN